MIPKVSMMENFNANLFNVNFFLVELKMQIELFLGDFDDKSSMENNYFDKGILRIEDFINYN